MNLSRLARWRVPIAFLFAVPVAVLARPTPRSIVWGGALAIAGELLRIWAAGHLEKSREVTASGPYRLLRHPLYVGSTLMGIGLAVASARIVVAVLVGVYLVALVGAAVQTEEKFLRSRFGARYDDYLAGAVTERRFSVKRAIANREYRAVLGMALVFAWLLWRADW
jgi:protein-S-isoprenylcysteine O-methyltransferase Ste14